MRLALLLSLCLGACAAEANLCPEGLEPGPEDNCVPEFDAGGQTGGDAAGEPLDAMTTDAGDADVDARTADDEDAGTDAGADSSRADAEPTPHCAQQDVRGWDAFHGAEDLNDTLMDCASRCEDQACLVQCSTEKAGVAGCHDCIDLEATCLFETCWLSCGHWESSPVCRACLCEAGCTARFEACAERSIDTCEGAFDRPVPDAGATPDGPLLLRYRGSNGWVLADAIDGLATANASLERLHTTHWSVRWTAMHSFEHADQTYLVQQRSECGTSPCNVRISPLYADGSLGAPVYEGIWTRGWDEVEFFPLSGALYMLTLKTGAQAAEDPGPGGVRVFQLDWASDDELTLTTVLDSRWAVAAGNTWSSVEAFSMDGTTYLLRYASEPHGDVDILRVGFDGEALTLEPAGEGVRWDQGFDQVHTFRAGGQWFVLRYKGGTLGGTGVPTGSVEIVPLSVQGDVPVLGEVVFSDDWGEGITHVQAFHSPGADFLFANRPVTPDRGRIWRLNPTQDWGTALGALVLDESWNSTRPWDVVTVAKNGRWAEP